MNRRKHGLSFEEACHVFDDPLALCVPDPGRAGEPRWRTIGQIGGQVVVIVAHTVREVGSTELVRIISARPATTYERKRYEEET